MYSAAVIAAALEVPTPVVDVTTTVVNVTTPVVNVTTRVVDVTTCGVDVTTPVVDVTTRVVRFAPHRERSSPHASVSSRCVGTEPVGIDYVGSSAGWFPVQLPGYRSNTYNWQGWRASSGGYEKKFPCHFTGGI